jgi:Zn-dependent protease
MQGKDPTNWMYTPSRPVYYQSYGQRPKGLLSREEKFSLALAMGTLTLCLTMVFLGGAFGLIAGLQQDPLGVLSIALIALLATATGFAMHELAHKFVAQRYGCWAEFRYSMQGLFIALLTAAIGFLFAAPGAVYIAGNVGKRENGIISIAGPLMNVVVTLAMLPIAIFLPGTLIRSVALTVAFLNIFLAAFNMVPVMPLDGAKVVRWSIPIYVGMLVLVIGLLAFTWLMRYGIIL